MIEKIPAILHLSQIGGRMLDLIVIYDGEDFAHDLYFKYTYHEDTPWKTDDEEYNYQYLNDNYKVINSWPTVEAMIGDMFQELL